jgi:hypothetical protein
MASNKRRSRPSRRSRPASRRHHGNLISSGEAARIRSALSAYEKAQESFDPKRHKRGGGWTESEQQQIAKSAGGRRPTNEELSELEVYEFMTSPPERLFAYYNKELTEIHNWMGVRLGRIIWRGHERRQMGGKLVSVRAIGENGRTYVGTCNMTGGTYCKLRLSRSSR